MMMTKEEAEEKKYGNEKIFEEESRMRKIDERI